MKENRLQKIIQIINENIILTQEDLQAALLKEGFDVTQSTVSRDIKRLKLVKGHDAQGNYRYISADKKSGGEQDLSQYKEMISKSVISVEYAFNDIVIKCYNGMASSVCVAVDAIFSGQMLGTLAGEDTIFIVVRSAQDAQKLAEQLKTLF